MAAPQSVKIGISAKDDASPVLARLEKSLGRTAASGKKAGQALSMNDVSKGWETAKGKLKSFYGLSRDSMLMPTRLVPQLAALTSAASIAGVGALADQYARFGTNLLVSSQRAGVSVQRLQQLQDAVQLGGGDPKAMGGALASLHDAATGTLNGTNVGAIRAFASLGISDVELQGPTDALFETVRKKLAILQKANPLYAQQMGSETLGGAYDAIQPAITRPDKVWDGYEKKAGEIDPALTEAAAKKADELREDFDAIDIRVHAIGKSIGTELGPAMITVAESFDKILKANQADIGQNAREFAAWVGKQNWHGMETEVASYGKSIDGIVEKLGGWKLAVEILGAAWVLNSPVGKLTRELGVLAAWTVPKWIGMLLGLPGGAVAGGAYGALAAGAYNGKHNATMLDEFGREISNGSGGAANWGGEEGERNRKAQDDKYVPGNGNPLINRLHNWLFGGGTPALPKGEQDARSRQAFKYFTSRGWSPAAAAGIVAGGLTESGWNEKSFGDNNEAFGLFQWHGDRQDGFRTMFGHDILDSTFEEQLAYKDAELRGRARDKGSATAGRLMDSPTLTPGMAGVIDSSYAERPADTFGEAHRRAMLAERLYQQYTAPGADVPTIPPSGASPDGGGQSLGKGRLDVHVTTDGPGVRLGVPQQPDGFDILPALPTAHPMQGRQGG